MNQGSRDGIVVTPILNYARVQSMVVQPDGIVASGYAYDGSRNLIALARYTLDGQLDTQSSFGPVPTLSIGDVSKSGGNPDTTAFNFTVTCHR